MSVFRLVWVFVSVCLLGFHSPPAKAAYMLTFTGVVKSGADGRGLFGPPGGTLTGLPFKSVFVVTAPHGGPFGNYLATRNDFTVNGVTRSVTGGANVFFSANPFGYGVFATTASAFFDGGPFHNQTSTGNYVTVCCRVEKSDAESAPFTFDPVSNFPTDDAGTIYNVLDPFPCETCDFDFKVEMFLRTRTVSLVEIAAGSAVPEPQTWLMLVCGVGAVGAGLRRRRNAMSRVAYAG